MRLLVIDDSPLNRIAIKDVFPDDEILEAGNGQEGIEVFETHTDIDFVIVDEVMSVMDGITFVKELNDRGIKVPIFAVLSDVNSADSFYGEGVLRCLYRPLDYKDLKGSMKAISSYVK